MTAASESLCCTLLLFVGAFADEKIITAQSGQNVILPCRALNTIISVEWSRPDLNEEYVLLHRDGHFDAASQHPSFKKRVDLQDREMKDGNVSLILNDVTINDAGKYECSVTQKKDLSPYTTTITVDLRVINSKGRAVLPVGRSVSGSFRLVIGLYVPGVLLVAAFVF